LSSFVERARAEVTCAGCGRTIAEDDACVVEGPLFHHVACAVRSRRQSLHDALLSRETPSELVWEIVPEVEELDGALAERVRSIRTQRIPIISHTLDDPPTLALLAELEPAPQNRELLAVLADHLQQLGDPRGELIALELAGDEATQKRRRELANALLPKLALHDRAIWGIGFITALELTTRNKKPLHDLAAVFGHPSCRLVAQVSINRTHQPSPVPLLAGHLPRSVRRIEVGGGLAPGSDLAGLAHLEHLLVDRFAALAHPTLPSLELDNPLRETLDVLHAAALPAVKTLVIRRYRGAELVARLVRGGWFAQLDELVLDTAALGREDVRAFEAQLARRPLARLSLARCGLYPEDRARLAPLCTTLALDTVEP
jgi:hypothetical protein